MRFLVLALLVLGLVGASGSTALAYGPHYHGPHHGWHGYAHFGPPVIVAPPTVIVTPAPMYMAPSPVYVAPAPVYVAPAPVYRHYYSYPSYGPHSVFQYFDRHLGISVGF